MRRRGSVMQHKDRNFKCNTVENLEWVPGTNNYPRYEEEVCDEDDDFPEETMRTEEEILDYMNEATDKVWLMRSRPTRNPQIERRRQEAIRRILRTYDDIPPEGYSDWECGYWNGVMGALRWALGSERDFLDT